MFLGHHSFLRVLKFAFLVRVFEGAQALFWIVVGYAHQTLEFWIFMLSLWLTFGVRWLEFDGFYSLFSVYFLGRGDPCFQRWFPLPLLVVLRIKMLAATHGKHWMSLVVVDYWTLNMSFISGELGRGMPLPLPVLHRLLISRSNNVNCFTICHFKFKLNNK